MTHRRIPALLLAVAMAASVPVAAQTEAPVQPASGEEAQAYKAAPYQRVVDVESGGVALQMAVREFAPSKEGQPKVYLAGAVHIGNQDFYDSLQEFLDEQDIVLFEGVKPPGSGDPALDLEHEQSDEQKAKATERRVRFIAMAAERFRTEHDHYPASMEELVTDSEHRIAELLRGATDDAWGRALVYELRSTTPGDKAARPIEVMSLGADGEPGGEGPAADIRYTDQKSVSRPEAGDRSEGIQQKLATALGVVFQLEAMDHDKPNWRNSDLAIDQVQARLEKAGASGDALFKMLDGSSFMGRLAGVLLGIMSRDEQSRTMLRIMMIEMLAVADELLPAAAGAGMESMMEVLLEDRNAVVFRDLDRILESEEKPDSVAIIYGAGHLPTMERRLVEEYGYRPVGDTWRTAMDVNPAAAKMSPAQFQSMRQMMSEMIKKQLEQAKKQARKQKKAK
jgi:hypothetical protein